jgi:hypothetical protein
MDHIILRALVKTNLICIVESIRACMWISVAESVQVLKKRGPVAFWHARE